MLVAEIMTRSPVTTQPDARVAQALRIMEEQEYHQLPVLSREGHLVGIINQRDCRQALGIQEDSSANGASSRASTKAADPHVRMVMRPAPIVVEPDTPVQEAARLMTEHHVRALPVIRGETLIGILTVSDLLIAFMRILQADEIFDSQ